jgi:hypothetical protein
MESLGADGGRRPAIKESLLASERPESKRFLTVFFSFGRPPHSAVVARLEAAPARRSVPPSFTRRLGLPELPEPSKESIAADGGAWQGNQSIGSSRWRGPIFFKNRFARCSRNQRNRLRADAPALIDALPPPYHITPGKAARKSGR